MYAFNILFCSESQKKLKHVHLISYAFSLSDCLKNMSTSQSPQSLTVGFVKVRKRKEEKMKHCG